MAYGVFTPVWAPTDPVGESNVSVLSIGECVQPTRSILEAFIQVPPTLRPETSIAAGKELLKPHCQQAMRHTPETNQITETSLIIS
jgi:hypothetical protein